MSKFDMDKLGNKKGLAVEGKDDKTIIEAFLEKGETKGHWSNWDKKIQIQELGGSNNVLSEIGKSDRLWGLIDRDWRTDSEIEALQNQYPRLLILPRVTIENYLIAPDEVNAMLPLNKKIPNLAEEIARHVERWVQNGALHRVLYERGAHDFCRGVEGYPKALFTQPISDSPYDEAQLEQQLRSWHEQLEPRPIMDAYHRMLEGFLADEGNHYTHHIQGKDFFKQVLINQIFRRTFGQKSEERWLQDLIGGLPDCPTDMIPLLAPVVA